MDADYQERQRDCTTSRRAKRWSMNSQRLEQIVAELMKPISDIRRSFDTDLSALLEEYLTEAGLHALEESEGEGVAGAGGAGGAPNYAELALLLQHSASVYGRKVDFLYQHVLSVSDSLHNNTQEETAREAGEAGPAEGHGEASPRRRRRASAVAGFSRLELEPSASARREPAPPRPPPTLPRMYIELEPRVIADGDAPLRDYCGEPVGLPADFHVVWRLQDGFLVDELEESSAIDSVLNPISLVELQAAIEAAAPPTPPPPLPAPLRERSPSPAGSENPPLCASTPLPLHTDVKRERKRRSDVKLDDLIGSTMKLIISKELRRKLRTVQEFSISESWISRVVRRRARHIAAHRRKLASMHPTHHTHPTHPSHQQEFHGFDLDVDIGGFIGWSSEEARVASAAMTSHMTSHLTTLASRETDSDDDGFFEQSSNGDSDHSRVEDLSVSTAASSHLGAPDWAVAASQSGALAVRVVARDVLAACPAEGATPFAAVLDSTAKQQTDVSRILLATLFLATAGNLQIIQGAPLSTGSFSLKLISTDEGLYTAAAKEHFQR